MRYTVTRLTGAPAAARAASTSASDKAAWGRSWYSRSSARVARVARMPGGKAQARGWSLEELAVEGMVDCSAHSSGI